jgi:tetratricopeptide (TPR) repeat protein
MGRSTFFAALVFIPAVAAGQAYPSDPEKAALVQEKFVLFSDYFRNGDYDNAKQNVDWLLQKYPDVAPSIYINGIKIYEALEEKEQDIFKKQVVQEKIISLYDQRIVYFNDKDNVINRKAYAAYRYYSTREDKLDELLHLFDEAFKSDDKFIMSSSPLAYMDIIRRYQQLNQILDKAEILDRYNRIATVIKSRGDSDGLMDKVDNLLLSIVDMDCDEIAKLFGIKDSDVQDVLETAKKYMGIALAYNCKDHPMFLKAAIEIFNHEPVYGLAKLIAILYDVKDDHENAGKYFHQALKLADDERKAAEANYLLAVYYQKRNMKVISRRHAMKAAGFPEYESRAYKLIGDLYFTSFKDCMELKSPLTDRAVFLAAYEMYKKAGDEKMMEVVKQQFPSAEDIHAENKGVGDQILVGCWIKESVTIRKR